MTTLLLTLSALMVISNLYILIPLVNPLADAFHASVQLTASLNSIFSLCYAIGFLFFGPLAEKYGKKQTIVGGMFLLSIVSLITSFAVSLEFMMVCRACQGFVAASFAPAAFAYIFECFPTARRMAAMTWVTTGFLAAGIIGQIMSLMFIQLASWRYLFVLFAGIYLCLCFASWKILAFTASRKKTEQEQLREPLIYLSPRQERIFFRPAAKDPLLAQ